MDAPFDPYCQWLGVTPSQQPATCYQLLGLRDGESDASLIMAAAERHAAVLETHRGGPYDEHCNRMLSEIRQARDTLLDPTMRGAYNAALRQASPPLAPPVGGLAEPPATVPMAAPIASPSSAATAPPVNPLAPPVPRRRDTTDGEVDGAPKPDDGMGVISWMVSIASVLVMLVAVWLMFSSRNGALKQNAGADGAGPAASSAETADPTTEPAVIDDEPIVIMQEADGSVVLRPFLAERSGEVALLEQGDADLLGEWDVEATAAWRFRIVRGGVFKVLIQYAADAAWTDAEYEISIGSHSKKKCRVRSSGGMDRFHEDEYFLSTPINGEHTFSLRVIGLANGGLMSLRSIRLIQK